MCVSIMQMRVENQYMAALQIIEEEQLTNLNITSNTPQNVFPVSPTDTTVEGGDQVHPPRTPISSQTANLLARTAYGIRWREKIPFNEGGHITPSSGDFGSSERLPTVSSNSGYRISHPSPPIPPPVLGVFIARTRSLNKRPKSSIRRVEEELLTNAECETKDEPAETTPLPTPIAQTILKSPAQLSVITESTDEDASDTLQKKRSDIQRPSQLKATKEDSGNINT
uniref:Uncharacterized protein n=1 Tax=Syphacia muris TaxID=451379 RepID=A0A0N5ADM3_9BILA